MKRAFAWTIAALFLTACGNAQTLSGRSNDALVVGSQDYYSNEIIAEAYAQALESAGYAVDRQFRIGQREVYLPELEAGAIDVLPEYSGNLLQYLDSESTATTADRAYAALMEAMPDGLRVLDQSDASDQDTYVVTREFAEKNSVSSLADLKGLEGLTLGGNSELETRPYGPVGLKQVYGVTAAFTPIEDSGGSLSVKALRDGDVQLIDVYSADPILADGDLVALEDPKGLFLSSRVVPVASSRVDEGAADVINAVSAALSASELVELNRWSVREQRSAAQIAASWLASEGLAG